MAASLWASSTWAAPVATVTIEVDGGVHTEVIAPVLNQDFQNPENYFGIGFSTNSGGYYGLGSQPLPGMFTNEVLVLAVSGVAAATGNRDTRAVIGGITLTNIDTVAHTYKVTFEMTDLANFPVTVTRGETAHTASGPNGTSYGTSGGNPLYTALIDGGVVHTLLDAPQSFALQPTVSITANDSFGGTVANLSFPGGPLVSTVAMVWEFDLDPDALASFNSNFYAAVPEPGSAALAVVGLVALVLVRVRRH